MATWNSPMIWRWVGLSLFIGSILLWATAEAFGFIGNTDFIGRVSMLYGTVAAAAMWRADENPDPKEGQS